MSRLARAIANGTLLYKLVAFEFILAVGGAGLATFLAGTDGFDQAKWEAQGAFGMTRLKCLIALNMFLTAKAYTSDTMGRIRAIREKAGESDTMQVMRAMQQTDQ